MLIDEVVITVRGGNGGNGAISFLRNGQTSKGGPDGGNGGNGGNLYFQGINDITALSQFAYTKSIAAEDGINGGKQNLYGRNGVDKLVKVPFGTILTDLDSNELIDIGNSGEKILIAKGGKGGRGNNEFKTATIQAPRYREIGEKGEARKLKLELKLIADVGLIGLPNAGKSSLLEALTNAKPKIANYPFTTLEPNLGVMDGLVMADIPGLIEGASDGKGLGDRFLKHIERTNILLHCIDSVSLDILKDYKTVRNELESYNPHLITKPELVVLTKSDLSDDLSDKLKIIKNINKNAVTVSVLDDNSLNNLKSFITSL